MLLCALTEESEYMCGASETIVCQLLLATSMMFNAVLLPFVSHASRIMPPGMFESLKLLSVIDVDLIPYLIVDPLQMNSIEKSMFAAQAASKLTELGMHPSSTTPVLIHAFDGGIYYQLVFIVTQSEILCCSDKVVLSVSKDYIDLWISVLKIWLKTKSNGTIKVLKPVASNMRSSSLFAYVLYKAFGDCSSSAGKLSLDLLRKSIMQQISKFPTFDFEKPDIQNGKGLDLESLMSLHYKSYYEQATCLLVNATLICIDASFFRMTSDHPMDNLIQTVTKDTPDSISRLTAANIRELFAEFPVEYIDMTNGNAIVPICSKQINPFLSKDLGHSYNSMDLGANMVSWLYNKPHSGQIFGHPIIIPVEITRQSQSYSSNVKKMLTDYLSSGRQLIGFCSIRRNASKFIQIDHWVTMVIDPTSETFTVYDTIEGYNHQPCKCSLKIIDTLI